MLSLSYHELIGITEEHEEKKIMVDDYMLHKVLDKLKKIIDIKKFDDTKIFIDTDDKLPDDITIKSLLILLTCVIKDDEYFMQKHF